MRDTIIAVVVIASIIGLVYWTNGESNEKLKSTVEGTVRGGEGKSISDRPAMAAQRKSRSASKPASSSQKLHSIYSSKELNKSGQQKSQKVVHGVPLDSFVDQSQNSLRFTEVSPQAPNGVRVFLQCFELQQGKTAALKEKECNELLAKSERSRRSAYFGQP